MFHIDPTCYNCLTKFSNSTKNGLTHSQKWSNSFWKWSNSKSRTFPCMNMPKNWTNDNPVLLANLLSHIEHASGFSPLCSSFIRLVLTFWHVFLFLHVPWIQSSRLSLLGVQHSKVLHLGTESCSLWACSWSLSWAWFGLLIWCWCVLFELFQIYLWGSSHLD